MNKYSACYMCDNARINEELTDDNDFSSISIGSATNNYRIMLSAGYGKPIRLEIENWDGNHWSMIGSYKPPYCPNCGRKIVEYTMNNLIFYIKQRGEVIENYKSCGRAYERKEWVEQ